ncbi:hypothetical protein D9M69_557710 [compost metagenome]
MVSFRRDRRRIVPFRLRHMTEVIHAQRGIPERTCANPVERVFVIEMADSQDRFMFAPGHFERAGHSHIDAVLLTIAGIADPGGRILDQAGCAIGKAPDEQS